MLELGAQYFKPKIACYKTYTVTENPSNEGLRFLKLSEFKQSKSFVRIKQYFKAKMA